MCWILDLHHVNYYSNLFLRLFELLMQIWTYIICSNLFPCGVQLSPQHKNVEPVCETSRYVSVTDACKKTCIQLCGVLEKLWPDRFEASTIVYARLLPSSYADGLWYTMLIWISLITLTLACIYCIIFRLNFLLW